MSAVLAFLTSRFGRYALLAAGLCVCAFFICHHFYDAGKASVQAKWDAQKEADKKHVAEVETKQSAVSSAIDTEHQTQTKVIYLQGQTIVKKIPVYIPIGTPDLPPGFRLLHDAAASGLPIPDAASIPDASSAPVATVAATVTANYTSCRQNAEQLASLQKWVSEQIAIK